MMLKEREQKRVKTKLYMIKPSQDIIDEESHSSENELLNSALIHDKDSENIKTSSSQGLPIDQEKENSLILLEVDDDEINEQDDQPVDPENAANVLFNDIFLNEFIRSK